MSQHNTSYTIGTQSITLHHQYRLLILEREKTIVKLTPIEYRILLCILNEKVAQDEVLVKEALQSKDSLLDTTIRENLEKHINNIRSKIRPYRLNIYRVRSYGYLLASEQKEVEV